MKALRRVWKRLAGTVTGHRSEADLSEEFESHIEMLAADNRRRGMSPDEARRAARLAFGGVEPAKERYRDQRGLPALDAIRQDLRTAWRAMRRSPGFNVAAVACLALGIGANTAIFSVVKAVLLNQLPYRDPDRLVVVAQADPGDRTPTTVGFTTAYDWRRLSHSFESMSLYRDGSGALLENGEPEVLQGLRVNYDYFDTLGVQMHLGRTFRIDEDRPDTRGEIILTHGLWTRRFGADRAIAGRVLRLNESSFTVVGVLPANFRGVAQSNGTMPEVYMPLGYALSDPYACRDCQHLRLIARLKPGVSVEAARAELNTIMAGMIRQYPDSYPPRAGVEVVPLRDRLVGKVTAALWILMGAVGFVLVIACANVANLLLARATGRVKEMALRAALGAGRWRLVRQLLTESLLLSLAGGAVGLLLARWGTHVIATLGPRNIPRLGEIRVDGTVLAFALAASVLTAALFGLAPALRASRVDLNVGLKESSGKSTGGRAGGGLRHALVTLELALAFVLVTGAGLLAKSFLRLTTNDPGYDPRSVLTFSPYLYSTRYQTPAVELNYDRQVLERLRATPGIESVAVASNFPLLTFDRYSLHIQDRRLPNVSLAPSVDTYSVSPDYFRVLRIPLKRGRGFTEQDSPDAFRVAIISEECARAHFPGENPIGKHIQLGGRDDKKPWATIVGIAGDVRQNGLDQAPESAAYLPQAQNMNFGFRMLARTTMDPLQLESAVKAALLAVDSTQPVFRMRPLDAYVADSLGDRSFTLVLLALFGLLALTLAAVGIYGVISYSVAVRTREMGIRMALGAGQRAVLSMVLRQGITLVAFGLAAGFIASLALTRLLATLLFEVAPTDAPTSVAVAAALALVALAACWIPARRAATVDPVIALRYE